jgi:hypothetical protein
MSSARLKASAVVCGRVMPGVRLPSFGVTMKYRFIIATLVCLCGLVTTTKSQSRQYLRVRERPLVRFAFECAEPSLYPKAELDTFVRPLLPQNSVAVWGERAYAYDLNGDGRKEYFVPLNCGATGNCRWGVFALKPVRLLGIIFAENIYIHRRLNRWSRLTATEHENASTSIINTYGFRRGRYRRFGVAYEASASEDNFPCSLLTVEPLCVPDYVPGSIRPCG